jgi:geranylgeranyl diphosphate synthase type I
LVHEAAAKERPTVSGHDAQGEGDGVAPAERLRFQTFAGEIRAHVEDTLRQIFAARRERLVSLGGVPLALGRALEDLTMRGGKRLRAVVLATGYLAVDPHADLQPAIAAGAAFELLQSYFLIHDDMIDGDDTRRGGPTVHVALARDLGGAEMGTAGAILAGDYAMALAQEVMASIEADERAVVAAFARLARVQLETIEGQLLDITNVERQPDDFRLEDLKTGGYTVRGPLLIGATLAGAPPSLLEACSLYALPLGIAFQLRDDLLGLLGDSSETGKPIGTDIRAGKMTHVMRDALQGLAAHEREALRAVMGNASASHDQIARAVELVVRSGAAARMEASIAELSRSALRHLTAAAGFSEVSLVYLRCLAARLTERNA